MNANSMHSHSAMASLSGSTIIDLSIGYDYSFDSNYDADYEKSPDSPTGKEGITIDDLVATPVVRRKISCAFRWMNSTKDGAVVEQSPVAAQRRLSSDRVWIDPSKFCDEQSPVAARRRLSSNRQWIDPSKFCDESPVVARRRVSLTQPERIAVKDLPRANRRRLSALRKAAKQIADEIADDDSGSEEKEDKEEQDDQSSEAIASSE